MAAGGGWRISAALTLVLCCCTLRIQGACVHQGAPYANNSSWRPESCQECTCGGDVVICKTTHCPNPHCDFQRGEQLRILSNQCCPQCVSLSEGSCQYEGLVYGDNSQWTPAMCSLCTCSRGTVSCSVLSCPALACAEDERPFTPAGECCPRCARTGDSCSWQGVVYRDGEQWKPSLCSRCSCSRGQVQCSVTECQQVACKAHENLVIQPGLCCPQCVSNPCLSAGKQYQHGDQWQKNSCTTCVCYHGQSKCHTDTCPPISCEKGQTKVKRAGQCCEECAAAKGSCLYEGTVRYHGDMWNGTGCEFCSCSRGQVLCRRAECGRVKCPKGSELVHLPGKCCPECLAVKPSCLYKGKTYKDMSQWTDGSCRQCECLHAQVTCYLRSCPTCAPGTLAVTQENQCCPECLPVQCHSDCLSCSETIDHCEKCRNPKSVLHLGRCLSSCPEGFYLDGSECQACRFSCASCSSGYDCLSCSPQRPLLNAQHDQCLASCPQGSYQHDQSHCHSCHESCSDCYGPSSEDCVSCSDPAALLKDRQCVQDCGPGFYSRDGICYACDTSCASCFPDNPSCMSCPPGKAVHYGKCVSECPAQHYMDEQSRCRACHSSCGSCWGPSVSQCTLCPPGLLLHQGQCVEACGEGLYSQDNTCHNCHPTCRSCLGPLASDCLRCLKPEEVLVPQSGDLQHAGICAARCPARSFLDDTQTCKGGQVTCCYSMINRDLDLNLT